MTGAILSSEGTSSGGTYLANEKEAQARLGVQMVGQW